MFDLITILGPTAIGKTSYACRVAYEFNGEIISADSRQIYKNLNIGTGKDLNEYKILNKQIRYHLIDIVDPMIEFNIFNYKRLFIDSYNKIKNNNKLPILCGGSGLYLDCILRNYKMNLAKSNHNLHESLNVLSKKQLEEYLKKTNPNLHNTTDLVSKNRIIKAIEIAENKHSKSHKKLSINFNSSISLGLIIDREILKESINERLNNRIKEGLIDEVEGLVKIGVSYNRLIQLGLEYKFISYYLLGKICKDDMIEKLKIAIHQFSKRQMTFFRYMEKNGVKIKWINNPSYKKIKNALIV